jgi:acyl-CoA hydrolase
MPGHQHEVTFACAVAWSGAYCVTVSLSGIQFVAPILIGDLVTVRARLIHTGTSSMHMAVDVLARDLRKGEQCLATSCVMVLVALDSPDGKPTAVPVWQPKDDEDRQLQSYARKLMDLSRSMEHEVVLLRGKAQHD